MELSLEISEKNQFTNSPLKKAMIVRVESKVQLT
jgi:hypothetical protein